METEDIINRASRDLSIKIEKHIRLHIRPKPKYLPKFVWESLLKKMLVLEEFDKTYE